MPAFDFIKTNPVTTASAAITAVGTVLGAFWAIDSHYASAAELAAAKSEFAQQIVQMRADQLDDKVFELQVKQNQQRGKLSPQDAAMLERYKRKLDEVHSQMKSEQKGK
ncbi:MAG TPA: hypothetical protein VFM18_19430 [Methanosarcina sp.]|nr:hypothetical protein [Methanosarcina sp.]